MKVFFLYYNLRSSRIDIMVPYQTTIGSLVRASEHVPSNSCLQKTNNVTDIESGKALQILQRLRNHKLEGPFMAYLGMHSKR